MAEKEEKKTEEIEKNEKNENLEQNLISNGENGANLQKLENKYCFWFHITEEIFSNQISKQTLDSNEYESQVKKIAEFDTIEQFWAIYQHLQKPDKCKPGIEIQLFKVPIKPMWEDDNNKKGGKLTIKLNKEYTTIIWEELILAMIGGILPIKDEINGIVFTSKKEFNNLQIWFRDYNQKTIGEIEQCIRDLIQIPKEVVLDIKQFFPPQKKKDHNHSKKENKMDDKNGGGGGYYNNNYEYNNNNFFIKLPKTQIIKKTIKKNKKISKKIIRN